MDKYEIRYHQDGGYVGYVIYRNGKPFQGAELANRRDAIKDAQRELQKLQRSEQQPLAA